MGFNFNIGYNSSSLPNYVERDSSGNWYYSILDGLFGSKNRNKGFNMDGSVDKRYKGSKK